MSASLERITDKILKEAKKEAQKIKAEYQKKSEEIESELEKEMEAKKATEKNRIDTLAKSIKDREISQEEIRLRLEYLNYRYKILNDLIIQVVTKIPKQKDYFKFLTDILKNSGWKEGDLILAPGDRKDHGDKLLKWAEKNGFSFKIVDHDQKLAGGIIIKKGKEAINASISTIVDELKDELLTKMRAMVETTE